MTVLIKSFRELTRQTEQSSEWRIIEPIPPKVDLIDTSKGKSFLFKPIAKLGSTDQPILHLEC